MDAHRKLIAWQRGRELALAAYRHTKPFPDDERFGLTSQIRRASVSVPANIAEGYARNARRELEYALGVALASLAELDTLFDLAHAQGYLDKAAYEVLSALRSSASKATYSLKQNLRR